MHSTGAWSQSPADCSRCRAVRSLAVDPVPIDFAGELNQLVLHVDDLVQPSPQQIVRSRRPVLLGRILLSEAQQNHVPSQKGNPQTKLQDSDARSIKSLQSQNSPR